MIKAIFSINNQGFIGKDNDLIIRNKEDLKQFKKTTEGNTVVMGRKTFESLGNTPLPNRNNIIISETLKSKLEQLEGGYYLQITNSNEDIQKIIDKESKGGKDLYVIGGAKILELFSDLIDEWRVSLFYNNDEIGDTKLGYNAYRYFDESIPYETIKYQDFDIILTRKNLDPRIFIYYDSMTGNTEKFVKKVGKAILDKLNKSVYLVKITEGSMIANNERGHLVTWTDGYLSPNEEDRIPPNTLDFVRNNKDNILTVSSTGQKNWGAEYCKAVDMIHEKYGIPEGLRIELQGNAIEVNNFVKMIKEGYEQELYNIKQQSELKKF